ncbi:MAG: hypothetical protein GY804_09400 [Alphaproteobacteria bacterium]|nr:hypothetical protein [Alphaproteobacteria bacterium]
MPANFSPIEYFFNQLYLIDIPYEILTTTFNPRRNPRINIDNVIREKILNTKVIPDIQMKGARTKTLQLRREWAVPMNRNINDRRRDMGKYSLYRVPREYLENSIITSVTRVVTPYNGPTNAEIPDFYSHGVGANTFMEAAERVVETNTNANVPWTPRAVPAGGDGIQLIPPLGTHIDYTVVLKISYDRDLTTLGTSAIDKFIKLAILATKAYIYNKLILDLDRGRIEGGFEIGGFKTIVDSWNQTGLQYAELLNSFKGVSILADPRERHALLMHMV